jgi:hypothetical protein
MDGKGDDATCPRPCATVPQSEQNTPGMRPYELERPVILEASLFRGFCLL